MLRAAVCAGLIFSGATAARADPGSEAMLRGFVAAIDASPDWSASVAVIRSEGNDTLAEGLVIGRETPRISISAERLRLLDLAAREGGGFVTTEIELTGGGLVSEFVDYRMPTGIARQVAMPDFSDVSFDPRQLMSSFARAYAAIAEGAFEELTIPEVTGTQKVAAADPAEPDEMRAAYRNISMTGFRDGVIEKQELGPFELSGVSPDGAPVSFGIEKLLAERIDLGTLARIFDERQYRNRRGDGIWRPLAARASYSGLSVQGPDGATFRMDEFGVETLDGRQTEKPVAATWDRLADPAVPQEDKNDLVLEALQLFSAWRVGTIRLHGLALESPADGGSFALDSFTVTGLSDQGVDTVLLKKLEGAGPAGFASLENLELAGLVFPDFAALMTFAALEDDAEAMQQADTVRSAFAALPRIGHFGLAGLAAGTSAAESVKIGAFTLDFRDWNEFFAQSTDIVLEGLDVPRGLLQLDPEAIEILDALDLDRITAGMSFSDRWSPEAGADEATLSFAFPDIGTVELSYALTGLTRDWITSAIAAAGRTDSSPAALATMYDRLGLKRAVVKVTDNSLLDRAFALAAKKQNLTVDGPAYREQMRGALPFLLSAAVPAELSKLVSAPLQSFLGGGQTLIAEIAPPAPIPLPELATLAESDPMALPARLGLTVRSEPAAP